MHSFPFLLKITFKLEKNYHLFMGSRKKIIQNFCSNQKRRIFSFSISVIYSIFVIDWTYRWCSKEKNINFYSTNNQTMKLKCRKFKIHQHKHKMNGENAYKYRRLIGLSFGRSFGFFFVWIVEAKKLKSTTWRWRHIYIEPNKN